MAFVFNTPPHKQHKTIPNAPRKLKNDIPQYCTHLNCEQYAIYGFVGVAPSHCKLHKSNTMQKKIFICSLCSSVGDYNYKNSNYCNIHIKDAIVPTRLFADEKSIN